MKFLPLLLLIVLITFRLGAAPPDQPAPPRHPNVIVIMADDLGYGDVRCYEASAPETPQIDRLAAAGIRFTNGYSSAATCTPTRYSFLTGKYAFRQQGTGIGGINTTAIIQPGTVTLASLLRQAGYATAVVGKWHLGLGSGDAPDWNGELKPGPLEIGFDYCFLLPNTNDRVPSVFVENHRVRNLDPADPLVVSNKNPDDHPTGLTHREKLRMDWSHGHNSTIHNGISRIGFMSGGNAARWRDEDLADEFVAKSVEWIEKQKDGPFFLFFASHDIHVPRMPHERFQGKTSLGYRGDAIVELDWCVGQLLDTLDRFQLRQNTLVIFCSDNGPVLDDGYRDGAVEKLGDQRPAGVFTGGKYTIFEGGTRTPFITSWPGTIAPGVSEEVVCTIDLPASLAALTGQKLPRDACPDSFDVLGALLGEKNATGREHLVQEGRGLALRVGEWKLLEHPVPKRGKGDEASRPVNFVETDTPVQLFNLAEDPSEENNLAARQPEKVVELQKTLQRIRESGRSRPSHPGERESVQSR